MADEYLLKLAREEPGLVRSLINAFRRTIDFRKGRGAMLASLRPIDPQVRAIADKMKESEGV